MSNSLFSSHGSEYRVKMYKDGYRLFISNDINEVSKDFKVAAELLNYLFKYNTVGYENIHESMEEGN